MRGFLLLVLLVKCAPMLMAQGSIEGYTYSGDSVLSYATVTLSGGKYGATTDAKGYFFIKSIPAGVYTIQAQMIGYERTTQRITIQNGVTTKVVLRLKENATTIDDVVISGTMKEVSKMNSPVPVEIYTPKFFLKNPTSNMFDALHMINGVQPTMNCNVCNTGDIHINGMEGPYTMILIDGMPIVSALSTVYGLSGIPNSMIERIEVVKGPASTLYGSEAVAGLINVITKKPERSPKFVFDFFGTSYGEYNADLGMRYKWKQTNGFVSANVFSFDQIWDKNKDNFTDITLQQRVSVFNKLSLVRKQNREASLALRFFNENRWGGETQWNERWRGTDSIYGESIRTNRFEMLSSYALPTNEKLKINLSYNYHHQNSYYGQVPYFGKQHVAFGQLLWDKKLGKRHDVLSGLTMRYTWYDDNTPATASGDSVQQVNEPSQQYLPGLFVQDEVTLHSNHTLLLGLRYDHFYEHGSIFSPRINYKWKPNRSHTVRLSAGNGFRVVNLFTEDHSALSGARDVVITERLKPEESWNVNLNHSWFMNLKGGFATLDATLFYTYFSNRIIADYDRDPTKIIYANLDGYAVSQGFSLNSEFSFTFPLKISAGFTLMDVYKREADTTGKQQTTQQIHAPRFSGTFQVSYTFNKIGLTLDYTGQVYGPMRLPVVPNDFRPEYSPWFSIQNVQFTKQWKKFQVYGGVKNLFNFMPSNPILRPNDPFDKQVNDVLSNPKGYRFDPSYNYAPMQGIRFFAGIRYTLN